MIDTVCLFFTQVMLVNADYRYRHCCIHYVSPLCLLLACCIYYISPQTIAVVQSPTDNAPFARR
ncbi:hypothetical protein RB213_006519 [Colletotrichum asianum]